MMKTKLLLWLCFLNGQLVYATIETALHDSLSGFPNVRDFAMSESQDEAYFTAQSILGEISVIMRVDKINNQWGKAKIAIFSGQHHDLEPFLSVDGNTLFFSSKRSNDFTEKANYDIWFVNRVDKGSIWSEPKNMGPHINSQHNEFYPSVAANNNFYFTGNKQDSKGKDDIYFSEYKDGQYQPSYSISKSVNTAGDEYNAYISKNEKYLIFGAYKRADGVGSGDLYVSYKRRDKSWSPALRLPEPVNSKHMDYCPFVIGDTLYFTSRRSDINPSEQHFKESKSLLHQINKPENGLSRIYKTPIKDVLPQYQSHLFPLFLIGKWKVKGKETYEQWHVDKNSQLIGYSYKVIEGKEHITENIKISTDESGMIYSATVVDQNEGKTIEFELNKKITDRYVFENVKHDFPNNISYQQESDNKLMVNVSNNEGKGFSYEMYRYSEKKIIPQWFKDDLSKNIGIWKADNRAYKSDKENQDFYEMQWQLGIGKTSITGRLYGIINGKKSTDFWHFRQYWDNQSGKAMLVQYGNNGITGIGEILHLGEGHLEIIQTFSDPNAKTWQTRHTSSNDGKTHINVSYKQDNDGSWKQDRHYIWHKTD